ncbi:hypothetical protein DL978_27465 [Escherichia coli]|nr:hypothetical protein [Escherichia coli]
MFIPCRPRLLARFFLSIKKPLRRGADAAYLYHDVHGAGCLPVSSARCHRTRVDNESQVRIFHQSPLRTGGFTMRWDF